MGGNHHSARGLIYGGSSAVVGQFPYFVDLGDCGGSLVAPNVVLTAAHCDSVFGKTATVGAYNRGSPWPYGTSVSVVEEVTHHFFGSPNPFSYDFKLIRLSKDVTVAGSNVILSLDDDPFGPSPYARLTVMGLGKTETAPEANTLRHVDVKTIDQRTCQDIYGSDEIDVFSMFCAGSTFGGKDSCSGDSGSPIVKQDGNKHIQVGVVSWGIGCGLAEYPGVYAQVNAVLPWIKQTLCDRRWSRTASFCPTPFPTPPPTPPPTPLPTASSAPTSPTPLPSLSPSQLPTPSPTLSPEDKKHPRNTVRFVIEPVGGRAGCGGTIKLSVREGKLALFGTLEKSQSFCNTNTTSGEIACEIIIPGDLDDVKHLFEMKYNGHSRSCYSSMTLPI